VDTHWPQALGWQHTPDSHPLDWQSPLPLQCWPRPHLGHAPPQSTSTSLPFFLLSSQLMQVLPSHLSEAQSALASQALPSSQRAQGLEPPQSASLSPWFLTPSSQVGFSHTP
jgi:hypothetical protein